MGKRSLLLHKFITLLSARRGVMNLCDPVYVIMAKKRQIGGNYVAGCNF
jgi:hypothetical protein